MYGDKNRVMTIEEYKEKFRELAEELDKEHGDVQFIHIEKDDLFYPFPVMKVTITF